MDDFWNINPTKRTHNVFNFDQSSADPMLADCLGQPIPEPHVDIKNVVRYNGRLDLHLYRSKRDKTTLLDLAINYAHGDSIIATILHMKKTLKRSLFLAELQRRPAAIDHYLSFLNMNGRSQEAIELLHYLDRTEEAIIEQYKQCVDTDDIAQKLARLKTLNQAISKQSHSPAHGSSNLLLLSSLIEKQILLIEHQQAIQAEDESQERKGQNSLFMMVPRNDIVGKSVISTLYHCCLYHYHLPENYFACPKTICKNYHVSQKQFVWIALLALAKVQKWPDLETLLKTKSWYGLKKASQNITAGDIRKVLEQNDAPHDIIVRLTVS